MKVKEQVNQVKTSTTRVIKNSEQFVQAVSLLVIAGFSYYSLQHIELDRYAQWVVMIALVVIGLRGATELIKFLDRE